MLIVSNAPEEIYTLPGPVNLYKCRISGGDFESKVRVYIWHRNVGINPAEIGLFLSQAFVPATLSNYRRYELTLDNVLDILTPGMCLAEKQLYGPLEEIEQAFTIPSYAFNQQELQLWSQVIPPGPSRSLFSMGCSIHEFDITLGAVIDVRIACKGTSGWGNLSTYVADPGPHVRGWWPYTSILCIPDDGVIYNFSPSGSEHHQYPICESGGQGGDSRMFVKQADDEYGTGNKGCFGANLVYRLPAYSGDLPNGGGNLFVGMRSRGTGYKYAGAARVIEPEPMPQLLIPKYSCELSGQEDGFLNFFNLLEKRTPPSFGRGPETSITVDSEVANAGAATMPTNLLLSRTNPAVD